MNICAKIRFFFIYSCFKVKHPVGVRRIVNKRETVWQAYADVCNREYPKGKNVHLGTYNSIVDAICARRNYLFEISGVDLNSPEGFAFAVQKASEKRVEAKAVRTF